MTTLITGGNGFLANSLKTYIDGDFYGKDMLDVTDANCINNLPNYDILIHTATGNKTISDNIPLLLTKAKKIFVFTSKQGTFLNWKQPGLLDYGLEKLNLNFTSLSFQEGTQKNLLERMKKLRLKGDDWKYECTKEDFVKPTESGVIIS